MNTKSGVINAILIFLLLVTIVLAGVGIARGSWIPLLFSAVCLLVAGILWYLQRDTEKKYRILREKCSKARKSRH